MANLFAKQIMFTKNFDYFLPKELIAQKPAEPRDSSRLLVLDRKKQSIQEEKFVDIINYLNKDDVLVLNNTKVLKARIFAKKTTGGKIEIFLLKKLNSTEEGNLWEVLINPSKKVPVPSKLYIGEFVIDVISNFPSTPPFNKGGQGGIEEGIKETRIIKFPNEQIERYIIENFAQLPLPPYIHTHLNNPDRYQTVFAHKVGSVAAHTAGLHFTNELLEKINQKGIKIAYITLHLGLDSFRPIRTERLSKHKLTGEYYSIDKKTADIINIAKQTGKKIFACGTSVVRVLESVVNNDRNDMKCHSERSEESIYNDVRQSPNFPVINPSEGITELFITPGYKFKVVDALITNFHLPRSTNLVLVCAFANTEFIFRAYQYAIEKKFWFYSFGDATLIL